MSSCASISPELSLRGSAGAASVVRRCHATRCAAGGVAERLKAHAWKVCMRETVSRVRIPPPPPTSYFRLYQTASHAILIPRVPAYLPFPLSPAISCYPTRHGGMKWGMENRSPIFSRTSKWGSAMARIGKLSAV